MRKAFYRFARWGRGYSSGPAYKTLAAEIPFCYTCAELHHAEARKLCLSWKDFQGLGPKGLWVASTPVIALLFAIGLAFWYTRPDRFEPRSDITNACDFSKNVSMDFGRKRHIYSMRNKVFADAFIEANRDRVWTQEDSKRSSWRVLFQGIIFLGALIIARLLMWYYTGK